MGGDASSSSSSSVASPSSSSLAAVVQPLSLGLIGPSSSTQSPSSPWRSAPGPEPSTPSSPATENRTIVSVRRDSGLDGERGAVTAPVTESRRKERKIDASRNHAAPFAPRIWGTRKASVGKGRKEANSEDGWRETMPLSAHLSAFRGYDDVEDVANDSTRRRGYAGLHRKCVEQSHRVPLSSNLRTSVALPFLTLERITGTIERSTSTLKTRRGAYRRFTLLASRRLDRRDSG